MLPRTFRPMLLPLMIFAIGCGTGSKGEIAGKGDAAPLVPSINAGSQSPLDDLLSRVVHNGHVDCEQLLSDGEASLLFEKYLASVAEYGPFSHPRKFSTANIRAAYYLNAYIAIGLDLARRNCKKGRIIPADLEKKLLLIDGTAVSASQLESLIRNQLDDPRVVFLMALPTVGGPPLLSNAVDSASIGESIAKAAAEALDDPGMVKINHEKHTIEISEFFAWHHRDLESWVRSNGGASDPRPFELLIHLADERGRRRLNAAIGYHITVLPFDWTIDRHIRDDQDLLGPYRVPLYFGPLFKKP